MGTKKNTKVTLRYGTGVALTLSAVQVDILSHRCCVDTKRDHARQETIHVYVEFEAKFGELWAPRKTQKSHCVTEQVLH